MTILHLGVPCGQAVIPRGPAESWEQGANIGRRVYRHLIHRLPGTQQRISPGTPERASSPIGVEWRTVLV